MRRFVLILLFLLISSSGIGSTLSSAAEMEFQTGFHLDWWRSPNGENGLQYYFPIIAAARLNDFSLRVLGGHAYTAFDGANGKDVSLSHLVDTRVNLSYEIADKLPVDILIGIDFNLPTGKTDLRNEEVPLMMDPDLISIVELGEGFNVNPTLTVARAWGDKLVTGIGLGYVLRGEYDYSTDKQDYAPGDIFVLTAEARYFFSDEWLIRLFGNYSTFGTDQVKDKDFIWNGDFFLIGGGVNYTQSKWACGLTLRGIIREESKFIETTGDPPSTQYFANRGDEFISDITFKYLLNDKTSINSLLRFLWLSGSDSPSGSAFDFGERTFLSLQVGLERKFTSHLSGEFNVKGLVMDEGATPYHPAGDQSYNGAGAEIKIIGQF